MEQHTEASPRHLARIAGALNLLNILAGFFAIGIVPAVLVVPGDAAATLENIHANEALYRLGLAAHMIPIVCNVPLVVILYELFKVVDRRIALLLVFFSLGGRPLKAPTCSISSRRWSCWTALFQPTSCRPWCMHRSDLCRSATAFSRSFTPSTYCLLHT